MLKCKVCGHEFEPAIENHYIARNEGMTGLMLTAHEEETLYDAWDCPKCGSQYIAQERKREYSAPVDQKEAKDDGT